MVNHRSGKISFGIVPFFLYLCIMDKTAESEIIDYLYEKMVALMMPITHMPQTFIAFVAPLFKPSLQISPAPTFDNPVPQHINCIEVSSILTFDKPELRSIIRLLVAYEHHSKPTQKKLLPLKKNAHSKLCKNNYTLCEFYNFMLSIKDDYIAYLMVSARVVHSETLFNERRDTIEFSVWLSGFDIIGADNKLMQGQDELEVKKKWELLCIQKGYHSDFSTLIGRADAYINIFTMDYTVKRHNQ